MAVKKATVNPGRTSNPSPDNTGTIKTSNTVNTTSVSKTSNQPAAKGLFTKENYLLMIAGLAIIALGMFLMSGGNSSDPNVFDQKEIYSDRRITIAPLLIILGLGLEVFAIFRKSKV